jgi:hypothetical protein
MQNLRAIPIGIAIAGQGSVIGGTGVVFGWHLLHVALRLFFHRLFFFHPLPNQAGNGEGCTGGLPPTEGISMARCGCDSGACL